MSFIHAYKKFEFSIERQEISRLLDITRKNILICETFIFTLITSVI